MLRSIIKTGFQVIQMLFLHGMRLSSFSLTSSFVSDDFYGMMDDNEGRHGKLPIN